MVEFDERARELTGRRLEGAINMFEEMPGGIIGAVIQIGALIDR